MSTGDILAAAKDAALVLSAARSAALATLEARTGHPYVSLVTIALDTDGAALLLLSKLARHTANMLSDDRASLLFQAAPGAADPMASARVTLMGRMRLTESPTARSRFLARHPDAQMYAGFADFAFYALALEKAHFIGGFGRIVELSAADVGAAVHAGT